MFCPQCGQEKFSDATNYCSRCGFLLTGTAELLQTGGVGQSSVQGAGKRAESPRKRGLKQGLFIFLLTFLVAPLVGMLSMALNMRPTLVGVATVLLFMGGILRMIYALMFEEAAPNQVLLPHALPFAGAGSLPPQSTYPVDAHQQPARGNWRDTNDLLPISVTEGTTKLLDADEQPLPRQ